MSARGMMVTVLASQLAQDCDGEIAFRIHGPNAVTAEAVAAVPAVPCRPKL